MLKISWAGRRSAFPRDGRSLPPYRGAGAHNIAEKGEQRRRLRQWIAACVRSVLAEAGGGAPEGVVFALPSFIDRWGQPAGSSYIGQAMDGQLVPDAMELAGIGGVRVWILNDAELAAASALFDERVIACGRALVFTLGTAIGAAVADPLAAAVHLFGPAERDGDLDWH
jgi:predicted NBD/HSP70 family sugar kinase